MKAIRTFDEREYPLEDHEVDLVKNAINSESKFIELKTGDMINVKSISGIVDCKTTKYWCGYKLSKDGNSFVRDGMRVYLEPHNYSEVKEIPIHQQQIEQPPRIREGEILTPKTNPKGLAKLNKIKKKWRLTS